MIAEETPGDAWVAQLRAQRGLQDDMQWDPKGLSLVFPDAMRVRDRVLTAITKKETIAVFGDYDCDGITSVAQIARCLRRLGTTPLLRLPHRLQDGYGLKNAHVEELHAQGVSLLITADTGINAHEAIETARQKNIDVIVLDHHHINGLPSAYAVLHPDLSSLTPPHPSAAGVTFLFLHLFAEKPWDDYAVDLALASFGTVADLVPLTGFNRKLVKESLAMMPRLPQGPVRSLIERTCNGLTISATDIAFRIAPRINAAGRMGDPLIALHALLDGGEALDTIDAVNIDRQAETKRSVAHALEQLPLKLPHCIVAIDPSYAPGVIGLIAGKLTEQFGRPSMAIAMRGDECTASLRSIHAYHISEGLQRIEGLLLTHGGHAMAAGCTFAFKNFEAIHNALNADIAARVPAEHLVPTLRIDLPLAAGQLTAATAAALQSLEPFGQGNAEPLFVIPHVYLESLRAVGGESQHLQARIGELSCIAFHQAHLADRLTEPVDIAARVQMQTWNGRTRLQLQIVDIRESSSVNKVESIKRQGTEQGIKV